MHDWEGRSADTQANHLLPGPMGPVQNRGETNQFLAFPPQQPKIINLDSFVGYLQSFTFNLT